MKIDIDIDQKYKNVEVMIKAPKMNDEVTKLVNQLKDKSKEITRISGKIDDRIYILEPIEVLLFYSSLGKVYASTMKGTYEIKQTLYSLEDNLATSSFVRISKSAIVNIKKIKNIEVSFNGSLVVRFHNNQEEIISRRYVTKFKKFIGLGGQQ